MFEFIVMAIMIGGLGLVSFMVSEDDTMPAFDCKDYERSAYGCVSCSKIECQFHQQAIKASEKRTM